MKKFMKCIKTNFLNYYLIDKENSKTSLHEYFKFATCIGEPFETIVKDLPSNVKNYDGGTK